VVTHAKRRCRATDKSSILGWKYREGVYELYDYWYERLHGHQPIPSLIIVHETAMVRCALRA